MNRILISNDDGIQSEGLHALVDALSPIADVLVVAPDREQSAVSRSLTMHRPLRLRKTKKGFYAVDGTPTDCILLGVNQVLKGEPPDLVVSGINKGGNLGDDIFYSGTVSAAMEAARLGIAAFAISLEARRSFRFDVASNFATRLSRWIMQRPCHKLPLLNVNVPNVPLEEIQGVRITRQGKRLYTGEVVEKLDPRGEKYYWIGGEEPGFEELKESDIEAVLAGFISITPLRVDMTDEGAIEQLRSWERREGVSEGL
jgi:5'-nucleotidase